MNDPGRMIEKWYFKLVEKFPSTQCREHMVMPNHFHCIIEISDNSDAHKVASLHEIMDWFKTMTTNEYIRGVKNNRWSRFNKRLWQPRYWDHIIRNEKEHLRIVQYILDNPAKWENDRLNGGGGNTIGEAHSEYNREPWMV